MSPSVSTIMNRSGRSMVNNTVSAQTPQVQTGPGGNVLPLPNRTLAPSAIAGAIGGASDVAAGRGSLTLLAGIAIGLVAFGIWTRAHKGRD